ncbi:hypothetical protein RISK_002955 [Rhodopirellula islandica]|uniref:Uncharacterized protein n=1 Tax=Rhodopirellula islandica TaxID=595434 RepID=A0A0J1BEE3_RHOIS|nr:hypothetical protein RISK_002955 [Rhodopirellula islandica]
MVPPHDVAPDGAVVDDVARYRQEMAGTICRSVTIARTCCPTERRGGEMPVTLRPVLPVSKRPNREAVTEECKLDVVAWFVFCRLSSLRDWLIGCGVSGPWVETQGWSAAVTL